MKRSEFINLRLTPTEKDLILQLARRLHRSPADAVRTVALGAAEQMTRPAEVTSGEQDKGKVMSDENK